MHIIVISRIYCILLKEEIETQILLYALMLSSERLRLIPINIRPAKIKC